MAECGIYYNEIDSYCCAWLRNLIAAGHLPEGYVDERDIRAVEASDLRGFTQCHFFAGIGGWPLALKLARWPDTEPVWTGSCPCQPFSCAGKRHGNADERHLWPDFLRLIRVCKPPVVFGEQVASKDGRKWLAGVRADLERLGYGVGAADLCAASAGAPHIRQRLWWVAESDGRDSSNGYLQRSGEQRQQPKDSEFAGRLADSLGPRLEERPEQPARQECLAIERGGDAGRMDYAADTRCSRQWLGRSPDASRDDSRMQEPSGRSSSGGRDDDASFWSFYDLIPCLDGKARRIEPGTFPLAHGIPARMGKLRAYGNAIVPQVAAEFISAYMEVAREEALK